MSSHESATNRLSLAVSASHDHVLGPDAASITLVEYGSYDCSHCRAANDRIAEVRTQLGDRLRYVFRHTPIADSELAHRSAELAESIENPDDFWAAHTALMSRSSVLTEEDLSAVASRFGVRQDNESIAKARARVERDIRSAHTSGVRFTPTFFINGTRYDGPWDDSSFKDALLGSLGHRMRTAALSFASWAPSTGVLLLLASVVAVAVANSPFGPAFDALWHTYFGFTLGDQAFRLSLLHWVNDGLLTIFFLVVGLEIKREFTTGSLASRKFAALPIAAAIGGMAIPVLLYSLVIPRGPWSAGWGVPMATDTAFAVALIAMMGRRVPVELRIFLTAAAIVDDIGAIIVVAIFYSGQIQPLYLLGAAASLGLLLLLNRAAIYRVAPYAAIGLGLWACVFAGGLHATLAGVLLALFIPTRPPPDYRTLLVQADTILKSEARHDGGNLSHGPSEPALQALDAIHDRMESPADRVLRHVGPRSSYFVLPVFALANAGVALSPHVISGHGGLMLAIATGLVIGKPLGFVLACALAVKLGWAEKPAAYSWRQLTGAGVLAGIGFTMSLFISGQAFPDSGAFAASKIAVFGASALAAALGVAVLWNAPSTRSPGT